MEDLIPDIHKKQDWKKIRLMSSPGFMKSHLPYNPDYKKVIYLVRDGRDVMVSAYNYFFSKLPLSFLDFLQLDIWPGHWHSHVLSWLENTHKIDLLLVRYEDLLSDTFEQLKNITHFIGLNVSDGMIIRAVRNSSFAALSKMEENQIDSSVKQMNLPRFFRAGKSGLWKQYFTPEHKSVFQPLANPALLNLGYINSSDW
jgi:hypothetical protein